MLSLKRRLNKEKNMTIKDRPIHGRKDFQLILESERSRTDRNDKMFCLILCSFDKQFASRSSLLKFIELASMRIRKSDKIGWYDDKKLGILLPDTSFRGAMQLTANIFGNWKESDVAIQHQIITYPTHKRNMANEQMVPGQLINDTGYAQKMIQQ